MLASWDCIAPYGRFVEIGRKDIAANSSLPMSAFARNAAFMGFDMATFAKERPSEAREDLEALMGLFAKKQLHVQRPLHVYSISDTREVFRLLSSGQLAGKFTLEVSPNAKIPTTLDSTAGFSLDPYATYVVAGGLGGLGRSTARWMAARNARNLILLSRSGARGDNAIALVEELTRKGVRVEAPACNITNIEAVQRVLGDPTGLPPIKGCIQASMVARTGKAASPARRSDPPTYTPHRGQSAGGGDYARAENDDRYFRTLFSDSPSLPEAATAVIRAVIRQLAKTVPNVPASIEEVDTNRRIQSYGIDSVLAVELRNWIKKELKADIAVFETQGASTLATLGRVVAEKSTLGHAEWM
ncbi:MAG: hypothetical protein LQ348_003840, partial [Seirophora lacunosa]